MSFSDSEYARQSLAFSCDIARRYAEQPRQPTANWGLAFSCDIAKDAMPNNHATYIRYDELSVPLRKTGAGHIIGIVKTIYLFGLK